MDQDWPTRNPKERILGLIEDGLSNLLYYDRKEDYEMSSDDIYGFFTDGTISIDDAVAHFRLMLTKHIKGE